MLVPDHQPRHLQLGALVIVKSAGKTLPSFGRIPEAEAAGDLATDAARLEIGDGSFRRLELFVVELGRARHDVAKRLHFAAVLRREPRLIGDLQTGAASQFPDRLNETDAGVLHQETDRRTMRSAAEAVVELLARTDRKRRGLLAVERAAGCKIGARLLQRHVAIDQVDNVDAIEKLLNERVRDHPEPSSNR